MNKFFLITKRDFAVNNHFINILINIVIIIILNSILVISTSQDFLKNTQGVVAGIWLSYLVVSLLNIEKILSSDMEDGTLDILKSLNIPYLTIYLSKVINFIIITLVPMSLITVLLCFLFDAKSHIYNFLITLILISPITSILSVLTSFLVNNFKSSVLTLIIYFPIMMPVLIIGILACSGELYLNKILLGLDIIILSFILLKAYSK
ncbi:MAG: heme exporter protein CcmB [Sphingobacteriia bacterium]|nr:heme exporter protein CcmB [Sphingobacteriia bacterium]